MLKLMDLKKLTIRKVTAFSILAVILALAALVRFYQIDSNVYMGGDEGRDAQVTEQMIETHKPILQGPPTSIVTDIGRVYYGPGYYYVNIPFFLLTGGNPDSAYIATALFGFLATVLMFLVAKDLFGWKAGLVSAALYAVSVHMVSFERWAWSPNWIPFFSLLAVYGLIQLTRGKSWGAYLLAVAFAVGWQLHYTFLFLLIAVAAIVWRFKVRIDRKTTLLSLATFLVLSSPLIINDFKYGFPNLKTALYYLFIQNKGHLAFSDKLQAVGGGTLKIIQNTLGTLGVISWLLAGLSLVALAFETVRDRGSLATYLLILWPIVAIVPVLLMYNGDIPFDERFVMSLLPWVFVMIGLAVRKFEALSAVEMAVLTLTLIVFMTSVRSFGLLDGSFFSHQPTGLANMEKAVDYMYTKTSDHKINFDYHPSGGTYPAGYLYIMKWLGLSVGSGSKTFSLYERDPGGIQGARFGPILVVEKI